MRRGLCLVIAAPSGAGKSSVVRRLVAREAELAESVSVTTRAPRPGEIDGREYLFRDENGFRALAAAGELIEHAIVYGRGYGTPRAPVEARLAAGLDVVLDIDWQGWRQVRAALPQDTVGVFLLPPSLEQLNARLRGRQSDSDAEIGRRMRLARDELGHWGEFDHVVINDDLEACVANVAHILHAARCTVGRSTGAATLVSAMIQSGVEG